MSKKINVFHPKIDFTFYFARGLVKNLVSFFYYEKKI